MAENCAGQGQKPARDAQSLWEFLLPRAEVLVGRGMPRAEMESMLLAQARAQGWREKVGETVSQAGISGWRAVSRQSCGMTPSFFCRAKVSSRSLSQPPLNSPSAGDRPTPRDPVEH